MIHIEQIENGRSMVEMLGVLAIIGVISIGGIAGYTYGMNRYRTNEILDGGNKRAYTVATQLSMGLEPNLSEFKNYNTTGGGTFGDTGSIKQWEGEFGLSVTGVTKPVCENLIRMIGNNTPLRAISIGDGESETELSVGKCADGENNLYLVYDIGDVGGSSTLASDNFPSAPTVTGGYCDTNNCITNDDKMMYNKAEAYCAEQGGTMVTASDLGCTTTIPWGCSNAPNSGSYWIVNDIGYALASSKAFIVDSDGLRFTNRTSERLPLCK